MADPLIVRKADGTTEPFKREKLAYSLKRAGASPFLIDDIVAEVEEKYEDGTTTAKIYREAFQRLKRERASVASRYSLKRAVLDLGPTGFPFEDFIAEIMKARGWHASSRATIRGRCATHEVDLIASKGDQRIGGEMKFHNSAGLKSDLKVALYVSARFQDLNAGLESRSKGFTESWLLTNTKFTSEALRYGTCAGLTMIGWSTPRHGNLQDLIEEAALHPVTALTRLNKGEKQRLLTQGHVLCRSIRQDPDLVRALGVSERKFDAVMQEVQELCGVGH
ncbi:ATPase [Patescibacteria group bacterium]|jgi:hypothetical protein|nr:ATPase [Patescibacteria group bacterium]